MRRTVAIYRVLISVCALSVAGCVPGNVPQELSADEEQAVAGTLTALGGVTDVSQSARTASAADDEGDVSALKQSHFATLTFGDCPALTITGSGGAGSPSLLIDFGTGCTPDWAPDNSCSGSMNGSIDFIARTLSLTFDDYTCGTAALDGTVSFGWSTAEGAVILTIDTYITLSQPGEDTIGHTGIGQSTYTAADETTTFSTYNGSLTIGDESWTLVLTDTPVSYPTYENYVPFGGSALLTNVTTGDTLEMFFDENSPVTGVVQVSVNGGRRFNYTLANF